MTNTQPLSASLKALLDGIAAAPAQTPSDAWTALIPAQATTPSVETLDATIATMRAQQGDIICGGGAASLAALRAEMVRQGLDGFIVPRSDEHLGEYVAKRSERLAWLTGFTGSAGIAVILADRAAIFVDGRYTVQVVQETDEELYEQRDLIGTGTTSPVDDWIADNLTENAVLGFDAWLHTPGFVTRLRSACKRASARACAVSENPIDQVWIDQPPAPLAPVVAHEATFAGVSSDDKRATVAATLSAEGHDAVVLSAPDSIAWLLNVRGGDVPFSPLPLSFAILDKSGAVDWFIDDRKLTPGVRSMDGICARPPADFGPALDQLADTGACVRLCPDSTPAWVFERLRAASADMDRSDDPCILAKACKSTVELEGMRNAHIRDGSALTRFLAWLDEHGPTGTVSEISAADVLEGFRADVAHFRGLSFPTISGAGPHGAIVHYRVSEDSNRMLEAGNLYLCDSGGQYLDGTTDVTRTIAIGTPSAEMRDRFTRVLKGHIALTTAVFPVGTTGSQLDAYARQPLWDVGLDYDHGTGHGVGHYLSVHEGPQRISKVGNRVALQPGMVLSIEPGFYKQDAFGIRIENLVAVTTHETGVKGGRDMLSFSPLTMAPIDQNLIAGELLNAAERAWLDDYHRRVCDTLSPLLDTATLNWLKDATAPLPVNA